MKRVAVKEPSPLRGEGRVRGLGLSVQSQPQSPLTMSRHAMPPAWLRASGGRPHVLILSPRGRGGTPVRRRYGSAS
jgi:hypothetical protein